MREINSIVIHCSATRAGVDFTAADIDRWHRERGMNEIGYHYVIRLDGTVEKGRSLEIVGAHCAGYNRNSVGVCYIGGLDTAGNPADTRTPAQEKVMRKLVDQLMKEYPINKVFGHREVAAKACPCFDVQAWMRQGGSLLLMVGMVIILLSCSSKKELMRKSEAVDSLSANYETEKMKANFLSDTNSTDQMEERMEQTVTTTMVKTVRERLHKKKEAIREEKQYLWVDSVKVEDKVVRRHQEEIVTQPVQRSKWYLWVLVGGGGIGVLYGVVKCRRTKTYLIR